MHVEDPQLVIDQMAITGQWARWGNQWHLITDARLACKSTAKQYNQDPAELSEDPPAGKGKVCPLCMQTAIAHRPLVYTRADQIVSECECGWYVQQAKGKNAKSQLKTAHRQHVQRQLQPSEAKAVRASLLESGELSHERSQFLDHLVQGAAVVLQLGQIQITGRVERIGTGDLPIVVAYEHQQRHVVRGFAKPYTTWMRFDAAGAQATPRAKWILEPVTWNSLSSFAPEPVQ